MCSLSRFLICVLALFPAAAAWGLSSDRDQPMRIEADRLDIDDAKGVSVYRGNVVVRQGTLELRADEIRAYRTPGGRRALERIVANGKPANFKQRPDGAQEDVRGSAVQIEYYFTPERLILQGNARLQQAGDEFSSHRIEYEIDVQQVKAAQGAGGEERVRVTLQPRRSGESAPRTAP